MKYKFALLLLMSSSLAEAEAINRCVDRQGQLSFQNQPCASNQIEADRFQSENSQTMERLQQKSVYRPQAGIDDHFVSRREQMPLQTLDASETALDIDNQNRCQSALRVAQMCGKHAGMFTCGEHGFQHEGAATAVNMKSSMTKSVSAVKMQECEQQLSELAD